MNKPLPSVSTRTAEFNPRELPLLAPRGERRPAPVSVNSAAVRIREALRRFFEEEM